MQVNTILAVVLLPSAARSGAAFLEPSCFADNSTATKLGVISYWWPTQSYYDTLPHGSMAVINPSNGIFDWTKQDTETLGPNICLYKQVSATAAARGSRMLGYVPTGYFDHSCNINGKCQTLDRIEAQVKRYFEEFPDLSGIFFDEVAPTHWNCSAFPGEYETLRKFVRSANAEAKIAFNTGIPDNCVVNGVEPGEILVLYEKDAAAYGEPCDTNSWEKDAIWWSTQHAKAKGIETWHLVHTASKEQALKALKKARHYKVDWFYATQIGGDWQRGDNTWGSPAEYWNTLKDTLHPVTTIANVSEMTATLWEDFGQKFLTVSRPPAQCCDRWDWVGAYKKGTWDRVAYLNSYNAFDPSFTLPLTCLNLQEGEYEFKFVTSVDNWTPHSLEPLLTVHAGSR